MSDTYLPGDTRQRIQDLIKRFWPIFEYGHSIANPTSTLSLYMKYATRFGSKK